MSVYVRVCVCKTTSARVAVYTGATFPSAGQGGRKGRGKSTHVSRTASRALCTEPGAPTTTQHGRLGDPWSFRLLCRPSFLSPELLQIPCRQTGRQLQPDFGHCRPDLHGSARSCPSRLAPGAGRPPGWELGAEQGAGVGTALGSGGRGWGEGSVHVPSGLSFAPTRLRSRVETARAGQWPPCPAPARTLGRGRSRPSSPHSCIGILRCRPLVPAAALRDSSVDRPLPPRQPPISSLLGTLRCRPSASRSLPRNPVWKPRALPPPLLHRILRVDPAPSSLTRPQDPRVRMPGPTAHATSPRGPTRLAAAPLARPAASSGRSAASLEPAARGVRHRPARRPRPGPALAIRRLRWRGAPSRSAAGPQGERTPGLSGREPGAQGRVSPRGTLWGIGGADPSLRTAPTDATGTRAHPQAQWRLQRRRRRPP